MANIPLLWSGAETGDITVEPRSNSTHTQIVAGALGTGGAYHYQSNPTGTAAGNIIFTTYATTTGKNAAFTISGTVYASFLYRPDTLPSVNDEIFCGFYTGTGVTTAVAQFHINSSGNISVYDSTGTIIAGSTGSTVLSAGTVYRIDVSANRTTGAWAVKINGNPEVSGSGASLGATNIGNFAIGKVSNFNSNTVDFAYDDIWIDSSDYAPSNYTMCIDVPTANGTTMSFTGGTGTSDYTQVNTIPGTTSTYVEDPSSTSVPVLAEFAMQTFAQMGITGATILGVQVYGQLKDQLTGTNATKLGLISGSTTSTNTTAQNLSTAWVNHSILVQNDPATSAAWTQSGIENMQYYVSEANSGLTTSLAEALITIVYTPGAAPTVNSNFLAFM